VRKLHIHAVYYYVFLLSHVDFAIGDIWDCARHYQPDLSSSFAYFCLSVLEGKVSVHQLVKTEEHGQDARQQNDPQRQVVVRRFHFAFQLDLVLIIKLAAVVFLFSQEGSKQRLFLLILFASLIYL
jgi:hypothetical protein